MTGWPARQLLNVAYAYLADRYERADQIAMPVYASVGVDPEEVEAMSKRAALDDWLNPPDPRQAAQEQALLDYLRPT